MSPVGPTSAPPRKIHIDLQPLGTSNSTEYERRKSIQSTPTLPSPSLVAAHAYYLQQAPIGQKCNAKQRRRSLFEAQQIPRRHSLVAPSGDLAKRVVALNISSPSPGEDAATQGSALTASTAINIKVEKEEVPLCTALVGNEVRHVASKPNTLVKVPPRVPFQFSHDHLREWGYAYLGNGTTADAFINAVSQRRSCLALVKEKVLEERSSLNMVTIRARVLPKAKERKPFLIQRQFDIEELRASIPKAKGASPVLLRRSSRDRRSSMQQIPGQVLRRGSADTQIGIKSASLGKSPTPVHIEYAVHYLPVLAALMLSGHVRKGDTIDLPIPHPESWSDTIAYIYTGRGAVTSGMHSNVLYLAGNI